MGTRNKPGIVMVFVASIGVALLFAGCSSAPKPLDEVFETRNQAAEYLKLADSFARKGNFESAAKFYRQAIETDSSVDHLEGVAIGRSSLGRLWLASGDLAEAEREFTKAADYARLATSGRAASLAATGLGELAFRRGDMEKALALFSEGVARAGKDEAGLAIALHDRASAEFALGRATEALADLEKAAAINLRLKRWSEFAANRYLLASVHARKGEIATALAAANEALVNDKKAENAPGVAADLAALAELSARGGKMEDSYWFWRRAFDSALAANRPKLVRTALVALRDGAPGAGRPDEVSGWTKLLASLDAAEK
jgi:tetratricopeptide (TPR) repeat protein